MALSASKDGFVWGFDGDYTVGTFVNGDPYVVVGEGGTLDIEDIFPTPVSSSPTYYNGSMINPDPKVNAQGFYNVDGTPPDSSSLNAVSGGFPFTLAGGDSLVSTECFGTSNRPQIKTCAVLTVLETAPPANSFRPGYCASSSRKGIYWNLSDVSFSSLGQLSAEGINNAPTFTSLLSSNPAMDHCLLDYFGRDENGRYLHPDDWIEDYGADFSEAIGNVMLMLNTSGTDEDKQDLLVAFLQYAIDTFECIYNGGSFEAAGGHDQGRLLPILMAGKVFNDSKMLNLMLDPSVIDRDEPPGFGWWDQTFFLSSDYASDSHKIGFTDALIGIPDWGEENRSQAAEHKTSFQRDYEGGYLICCTANSLNGQILSIKTMGLESYIGSDAYIEQHTRYMSEQSESPVSNEAWKYKGFQVWQYDMWVRHAHTVGTKGWIRKVGNSTMLYDESYVPALVCKGNAQPGATLTFYMINPTASSTTGMTPVLLVGSTLVEDGVSLNGATLYMNTITQQIILTPDASGQAQRSIAIPSDYSGTFIVQGAYVSVGYDEKTVNFNTIPFLNGHWTEETNISTSTNNESTFAYEIRVS